MANVPKRRAATSDAGTIISFFAGVARIRGLSGVFVHEVLVDGSGRAAALVAGFDEHIVEALFFDDRFDSSQPVFRSRQAFSVPVNDRIVGRVVDGLMRPLDGLGAVSGDAAPVFREAPTILEREPVVRPVVTGIKIIDTNLPIGHGQRELIIGDRKLGKSTMGVDIVLNQKHADPGTVCVYVLCGQKEQQLRDLVALFERRNAFLYTVIVAATAGSSFAEQYLAPFVGCAVAEHFRDRGRDALVVYDDLSKHAKTYRDIALLLERAPGRETYPGDVFSLHATLLERAAQLSKERGGGSLTALPIVETQAGDVTSFIPTNIISITDGQIYLERGLFQKGFIPAVNVGLSVSRVGSQVQMPLLRRVVGGLRLALSQHKELQKLSQLETTVSEDARRRIHRGDLILELLRQEKHTEVRWPEQVMLFYAVENGFFDDIENDRWKSFESLLLQFIRTRYGDVLHRIEKGKFDDGITGDIREITDEFKHEFISAETVGEPTAPDPKKQDA